MLRRCSVVFQVEAPGSCISVSLDSDIRQSSHPWN